MDRNTFNNFAIDIIIKHKLLNYVIKNPKCAKAYGLTQGEITMLKEFVTFYNHKEVK